MVNMKVIQTDRCPFCGCETVTKEGIVVQRCGEKPTILPVGYEDGQIEYREFACGYCVTSAADQRREVQTQECFFSEKAKTFREEQTKLYLALKDMVALSPVMHEVKRSIRITCVPMPELKNQGRVDI